jgi:ribonuclease VapC
VIIDTSAVIAILYDEAGSDRLARAIEDARIRRMSAGTLVELFVVVARQNNPLLRRRVDDFLRELRAAIEPVTEAQAHIAREAYTAYGKGRGVRAQLNFGDCFAYALARDRNEPLLFVGDDFSQTDIRSALAG